MSSRREFIFIFMALLLLIYFIISISSMHVLIFAEKNDFRLIYRISDIVSTSWMKMSKIKKVKHTLVFSLLLMRINENKSQNCLLHADSKETIGHFEIIRCCIEC